LRVGILCMRMMELGIKPMPEMGLACVEPFAGIRSMSALPGRAAKQRTFRKVRVVPESDLVTTRLAAQTRICLLKVQEPPTCDPSAKVRPDSREGFLP
jgi:hypothetical protein